MARVSVVVTTKNNAAIIRKCLDHIYDQKFKDFICNVADDGSTDETLQIVKSEYPDTKIFECKECLGPAHNRNKVLEKSNEEFVVFVDSDAFIKRDWLDQAIEKMEMEKSIGLIGGKVYDYHTDKIQSIGGQTHLGGTVWLEDCLINDKRAQIKEKFCHWLPSSTFMMRTHVAKDIGGFDSDYGYLYEDIDISWRVWLAGHKVLYFSSLESVHMMSVTASSTYSPWRRQFMSKRNKMVTFLKNLEWFTLIRFSPIILMVLLVELIILKPKGAIFMGNIDPFLNFKKILKKRKEIKKFRKNTDKEIVVFFVSDHWKVIKRCIGSNLKFNTFLSKRN